MRDAREILKNDLSSTNTIYTTFSDPFDGNSNEQLNAVAAELRWKFRTSNELVYQLRKESDPGSERYMYRYYYNGQRLVGSFGLSSLDMSCDAYVGGDSEGVRSLFINSEVVLSPFAVLEH